MFGSPLIDAVPALGTTTGHIF